MKPENPESFPNLFKERCRAVFGGVGTRRILDGFMARKQTWFRINTIQCEIEDGFASLASEKLAFRRSEEWPDAGWVLPDERAALLQSDSLRCGRVYVQGMASQMPVRHMDLRAGLKVLDMAAAPGSKTLQIAAHASANDEIVAVELVRKRKFKLQENLKRHGAGFVRVLHQDGMKVWRYRPEYFDRILLDAPCSSEGRFRLDDPETYRYWTPAKVREMVRKQRRLLYSAVHALKPGGILLYSTCAISPAENEAAVQHILEGFPDCMDVEPIVWDAPERTDTIEKWRKKDLDPRIQGACRLMPSERMEGFFVCRFVKTASSHPEPKYSQ